MNLLTSNLQCIECGCTELIKDYSRREIFCSKCGLVLVDTSLPGLNDIVNDRVEIDKKDYHKLKRFLYDFDIIMQL